MMDNSLFRRAAPGIVPVLLFAISFVLMGVGYATAEQQTNKRSGDANRSEESSLNNLDPEVKARLEAERIAFFEQTAELRTEIYKKKLAMKEELQKDNPDGQKLKVLKQELARLQSLLNKERYKFIKRMQTIHPQAGSGYYERGVMGRE